MRGITEERLKALFYDYQHKFLYSQLEKMYEPHAIMNILHMLVDECKELNAWQPIETAPKDREILVYAPPYQDLKSLTKIIAYHNSAGYCIDELRYPTHWQELPEDPK